jgi:tetratricopeptide (TPR) repeat protein
MIPSDSSSPEVAKELALIHREMIQLAVLVGIAVVAFVLTKALAASNRDLNVRNAAEWYSRGQEFARAGRIDEAIDAFRRATVRNRDDRTYVLALANALMLKHDYDGARGLLLRLRETAPEDGQINLDLARVAAARNDVTEAMRFYHDALYAPWPMEQMEQRRGVRVELIRFLLTHNQAARADAELLAAAADIPDERAHHVELANLFTQAGDDRHALEHLQRALHFEPEDPALLTAAGLSAYRQGQYGLAQRFFQQLPSLSDAAGNVPEVVDIVLSRDPMAPRIGLHERQQRLDFDLSYAQQRFSACIAQHGDAAQDATLGTDLHTAASQQPKAIDQDSLESALDLIARVESTVIGPCGPATATDQALLLIARQHGIVAK